MAAKIHKNEATSPKIAPKGVISKPMDIPSEIFTISKLVLRLSSTELIILNAPQELTTPPIGPKKSLKIVFLVRNGVKIQTIRGDKIVINMKFSIVIILNSQLIFQQLQNFHLQLMWHLNQNKCLKKL